MKEKISPLFQLVNYDNNRTYNLALARSIDLHSSIVYSALIAKRSEDEEFNQLIWHDEQYWISATNEELQLETALTAHSIAKTINTLIDLNLIFVVKFGSPQKRYCRINPDRSVLENILAQSTAKS